MPSIYEVEETNKMVEQENLDIRTITIGISLFDCMDADLDDRPGVAIIASVLSRIMPEAGFNATAFRQWAATEGYLRRDAEGKSTFMVRLHGKPPTRCVWLYLDGK